MENSFSYFKMIGDASLFVQLIMLILLLLSIYSIGLSLWKYKVFFKKKIELSTKDKLLDKNFSHDVYYNKLDKNPNRKNDIETIFLAGFKYFIPTLKETRKQNNNNTLNNEHLEVLYKQIDFTQSKMYLEIEKKEKELNNLLSHLGTIGSVSPYIGLLGTVVGIIEVMHSFTAIGQGQQMTIDMIAPGISEALIATAMGLIAAIPAYIANNKFAESSKNLVTEYYNFTDDLILKIKTNINLNLSAKNINTTKPNGTK
jgi:biopolymer transport protein TolQ